MGTVLTIDVGHRLRSDFSSGFSECSCDLDVMPWCLDERTRGIFLSKILSELAEDRSANTNGVEMMLTIKC